MSEQIFSLYHHIIVFVISNAILLPQFVDVPDRHSVTDVTTLYLIFANGPVLIHSVTTIPGVGDNELVVANTAHCHLKAMRPCIRNVNLFNGGKCKQMSNKLFGFHEEFLEHSLSLNVNDLRFLFKNRAGCKILYSVQNIHNFTCHSPIHHYLITHLLEICTMPT